MAEGLQLIIGADSTNNFTIYRDFQHCKLRVYFGLGLYETVDDDQTSLEYKLLLARLYNSGIKVKTLITHFGFSYPTYKRWGNALKSGDEMLLYRALSGRGGHRKLTPDIKAFIVHDFEHVYSRNKYSYSSEILQDIKDVFNVTLSSESIRPILSQLKGKYQDGKKMTEAEKKTFFKSLL